MRVSTLELIRRGTIFLLMYGTLVSHAPVAVAQQSEQEEFVIEEVIVIARRREEPLQQVPISITAFSANDIKAMSLTNLKELGQFTPNLTFFNDGQTGSTSAIVFIRGVGQVDPGYSWDPGVGIYMDGVYLGRMQGNNMDLGELERVEVLRGPQGTLYGRNTIGGASNLVSTKPTDELEGFAEITIGGFDRRDARASINLPLVPGKLAVRATAVTRNRDGFGTRLDYLTGNKIDQMGDRDSFSGRVLIDWKASDSISALLSFDGTRSRQFGPVRKVVQYNEPLLAFLLNMFVEPDYGDAFLTDSDFTSYSNELNVNNVDVQGVSLSVDWDIGDWALKSITSYRDMDVLNGVDPDGSIYTVANQQDVMTQDQFSQEFQFSGLAFDQRLNWVTGLYYFEEDGLVDSSVDIYAELYTFIGLDLGLTVPVWIDNQSYSVFGQGTYALSDQFSITAGLRYTDDKKEVTREVLHHRSGVVVAPLETVSDSWGAVTGRLGIEYQWTGDAMTYASVARGYKGGGINARGFNTEEFVPFDPEYLWTYEIGLRSDLMDNRVRFNTSVYYSNYDDIQFSVVVVGEDGVPIFLVANAAKARVKGFESELIVAPVQGMILSAGVGLIDAKYTSADPTTGITGDSKFAKTPKWSVTLAAEYAAPIGAWGELIGRLDWAYKTKIYLDAANSPIVVQNPYGLLNANLSLVAGDGKWILSAFVTNLTDKHYIQAGTDFLAGLGFAEVQYARPREWGLSFQYNF
jgi:iron complex outermembrane recepter protein